MRRTFLFLLMLASLGTSAWAQDPLKPGSTASETTSQTKKPKKTDARIKQEIISLSIASYSGSCPCPYNTDRGGRSCGRRSAYSRPGGASPLCYESDVTQKMVDDYRKRTKQ